MALAILTTVLITSAFIGVLTGIRATATANSGWHTALVRTAVTSAIIFLICFAALFTPVIQ